MPDRKEIIKAWENVLSRDPLDVAWDLIDETLELLKEQDSCENCAIAIEDRQPIVRCRDCKNSEHWYRDKYRCFLWNENGIDVFEDGFCNYGKHKGT